MGNLPFIKKKVEGFSFVFTVYSGLRVCFSPIWNLAPGSFPQTAGEKNPVWKTDTNSGFPHWKKLLHKGSILALSVTFGASSPKGRAFGSPRKLHLFAKASPFGRGGCERSEQTERASPLKARAPALFPDIAGAFSVLLGCARSGGCVIIGQSVF